MCCSIAPQYSLRSLFIPVLACLAWQYYLHLTPAHLIHTSTVAGRCGGVIPSGQESQGSDIQTMVTFVRLMVLNFTVTGMRSREGWIWHDNLLETKCQTIICQECRRESCMEGKRQEWITVWKRTQCLLQVKAMLDYGLAPFVQSVKSVRLGFARITTH